MRSIGKKKSMFVIDFYPRPHVRVIDANRSSLSPRFCISKTFSSSEHEFPTRFNSFDDKSAHRSYQDRLGRLQTRPLRTRSTIM